ncbi:MAG: DoxX family membrane protein [Actinophytocola sp.]|nr:DoxX family membrane protein [Actinophytocola sp.]
MSTHDELYSSEPTSGYYGRRNYPGRHDRQDRTGANNPKPNTPNPDDVLDEFESSPEEVEPATRWHAGLDLGLLILRFFLGGSMIASGLHRFGLFGGPGIDGFAADLEASGFTRPLLLSWATAVTEVGAGGMLVLGLFTPLAAAGVLGIVASAVYLTPRDVGYYGILQEDGAVVPGAAFPLMLAGAAAAMLFTGPGRVALDVKTPWRRRPVPFGIVGLLLAAGAAVAVIMLFR